MNQQYL